MSRRKMVWLSVALLGVILIAGVGVVGCHRPPMFCGGGFHGKEFPKHVLEKMDTEVEELELTAAQQERYREIRSRVESELVDIGKNRKAFFQGVKTEMDKDSPDLNVVADLLKARGRGFPERMMFFVDQFMDFYKVLNTEQKGEVISLFKKKFKKFQAFRELVCD